MLYSIPNDDCILHHKIGLVDAIWEDTAVRPSGLLLDLILNLKNLGGKVFWIKP